MVNKNFKINYKIDEKSIYYKRNENRKEHRTLFLSCIIHKNKRYVCVIITFGSHPCIYVGVDKQHRLYGVDDDNLPSFNVHGGLTFVGLNESILSDYWFFGADFCHYGDYYCSTIDIGENNKKWTMQELLGELEKLFTQIIKIRKITKNETKHN